MNEEFDFPEESGLSEQDQSSIQNLGAVTARGEKSAIHCLTIVGQVEGHQLLPQNVKTTKYEHVLPQLAAIEESPEIGGLLILINTVGGDIEAGLAIAELIRGLSTPAVSLVLGGGHSIGVPMAVAARVSMIAPSAAMTIHPVRMNGTVLGVPQTFAYLQKIQERIVRFVAQNSRVGEREYLELMHRTDQLADDMGSVIHGAEAVEMGLIDRLGTLSDALGELHRMIGAQEG
jgi:ATP-dependent protease ClpP protease subunit